MMDTSGLHTEWQQRIEDYCAAWTTDRGTPDFDRLSQYYAHDPDIIIFDTLPPLEGFRGFAAMRSIYPDLARLAVLPNKDVQVRLLADGAIALTTHTFRLSHTDKRGVTFAVDARQSTVWEQRDGTWRIVHEHPSTVVDPTTSNGAPE